MRLLALACFLGLSACSAPVEAYLPAVDLALCIAMPELCE